MGQTDEEHGFTEDDARRLIVEQRNWGRWGDDDQLGAVNLIHPAKRVEAAGLVRSGRSVSLARPFPKVPYPGNPYPAQHHMMKNSRRDGSGSARDYIGISYHGAVSTHIDALCHVWEKDHKMWNGRNPDDEITFGGATWGDIDNWGDGLVTRGVLLDVPRHRGEPFVRQDRPVHGWELEEICAERGIEVGPGDAVVVYSGRDAWESENGRAWGSSEDTMRGEFPAPERPGLHTSCLQFLRSHDCSMLVWDMMDLYPAGYDIVYSVHSAIFAYGLALVDNAQLEPLAKACAEEGRDEFMLVVAPLRIPGGTGSPANPLAIL